MFFTMLVRLIIAAVALYGMARRVDVYDALVSERVYKKAYSHEQALRMILNGECGAFNPLLLQCLMDIKDKIKWELASGMTEDYARWEDMAEVSEISTESIKKLTD